MNFLDLGYSKYYERDIFKRSQSYSAGEFSRMFSNFEWDKGSGGVATLGGSDNADGYILVKDRGGNPKVVIDNEGLKIYGTTIISIDPTTNVSTEYTLHAP